MSETTEEIIILLKKYEWISGEHLAESLHVSRTAIWKHIQQLKKKGYLITAKPNKGYQLLKTPERLTIEEIKQHLHTSLLGNNVYHLQTVTSTNDYARTLAKNKEREGTIVVADEQTGGRGRKQRPWNSPNGGLWFSLLLKPSIAPSEAMQTTMCAACALSEAINQQTSLIPSIKWPNDILINKKKVCGILTELSAEIDMINYLIIGIGLNVNNQLPKDLQNSGTSLKKEAKRTIEILPLFINIIESFERYYTSLLDKDIEKIRKTWISYSSTIGTQIKVKTEKKEIIGKAIDIGKNGELLVLTSIGERKIITGDITYL